VPGAGNAAVMPGGTAVAAVAAVAAVTAVTSVAVTTVAVPVFGAGEKVLMASYVACVGADTVAVVCVAGARIAVAVCITGGSVASLGSDAPRKTPIVAGANISIMPLNIKFLSNSRLVGLSRPAKMHNSLVTTAALDASSVQFLKLYPGSPEFMATDLGAGFVARFPLQHLSRHKNASPEKCTKRRLTGIPSRNTGEVGVVCILK
jgi:hypothetical protein